MGGAAGALAGLVIGKYEENQVKTAQQVYNDYPEYSQRASAPAPAIKDLKPVLLDQNNKPIESFAAGQTIKMASEYTIDAFSPTPISNILHDPRSYDGKEVVVSGKAVEVFSIVVMKYFIVRDETGDLVVITERPLPRKGEQVKVAGKVEIGFSLGDQQIVVLVENQVK